MNRSAKLTITLAAMAFAQQVAAQQSGPLHVLLEQDVRLAAIAERLLEANQALCRLHMPLTGLVIHSRDQYQAAVAGDAFANGPVAVAAVIPGSAAASTIAPRDGLVAIGSTRTEQLVAEGNAPLRDAVFSVLAGEAGKESIRLTVTRGGQEQTASLPTRTGCRALVEIRASSALDARSDGRVIQVNHGLAAAASDNDLAVIFAHELGHLVLDHRRRLEQAGVEKGFFGEFGRNQRLNRQVEVEADRISVHLLANAGYDPAIAPAFWRSSLGRRAGGGLLISSTYPSAEARAQLIEQEMRDYLGGGAAPSYPGHLLARRDVPFSS